MVKRAKIASFYVDLVISAGAGLGYDTGIGDMNGAAVKSLHFHVKKPPFCPYLGLLGR